jgi:maltose alpha-D-glucosyltransferase/alpha-amylase
MNLLLLSLPGTPVLYYGDEIGMGDNAYLGDRDGVRTPMQWSSDRNGGFSRSNPQRLILPTISDPEYRYETVNVEVQEQNVSSLLWWTKRMIALRKQHRAFGRGSLRMLAPENRKVLAFLREDADETLLVVVNLSRYPQWVELGLADFAGKVPVELLGNGAFPAIGATPYRLTLGGHDGLWLSLSGGLERQRPTSVAAPLLLPVLEHAGAPEQLFEAGSALEKVLAAFVPAQRWFRSKSRVVARTRVLDAVPLSSDGAHGAQPSWLSFVEVRFAEGEPETYVLPLHCVSAAERPDSALLRLTGGGPDAPTTWLCDASQAAEIAQALHQLAFGQQRLLGKLSKLQGYRYRAETLAAAQPVKPLGAEQSNTSFVFGQELVGKLVRRVELGGSLEVEVLESLRGKQRAANVPVLEARIDLELGGGTGTLWMSEGFVVNEGDAWHLAIDHAQRFYESALTGKLGQEPPALGGIFEDAPSPAVLDFLPLARLLGRRTAELHAALFESSQGGPSAPKAFNALSSRAFYQSLRNLTARAFDALKPALLSQAGQELARAVLQRKAELRKVLDYALAQPFSGQRMRIHGDYHLGQVLYTGSDFYIIDFEGEPARSPTERRRLRSPLADLAGMIRSFHYAAFGVLYMPLPGAQTRPEDRAQLAPWARYFHQACSAAFTSSYLASVEGAPFASANREQFQAGLLIHLLEKALYELLYELDNRPLWAELPLRGLLALLDDV